MPLQPSRNQLHVNVPLRNLSIQYMQDQTEFVAADVFPVVNVQQQSNVYYVYRKGDWFRTVASKRAPATASVGTGYSLDNSPSYFCDRWAAHHDIPDEDFDNSDFGLDVENDAVDLVTRNLLIRRELVFVKQFMRTNTWTGHAGGDYTGTSGSGYWNSSNSNPPLDIDNLKRGVHATTGYTPNTLVMTSDILYALRNHPLMIDKFKYTQPGILDQQMIAMVFGVPRVFIVNAILNTAQEGQTDNLNYMASNTFLLCYAAPSPGLKKASAGYTFSWTGRIGAGGYNSTIEKWYMQELKATRVEGEMAFDMRATGLDLGVLGTNVLT